MRAKQPVSSTLCPPLAGGRGRPQSASLPSLISPTAWPKLIQTLVARPRAKKAKQTQLAANSSGESRLGVRRRLTHKQSPSEAFPALSAQSLAADIALEDHRDFAHDRVSNKQRVSTSSGVCILWRSHLALSPIPAHLWQQVYPNAFLQSRVIFAIFRVRSCSWLLAETYLWTGEGISEGNLDLFFTSPLYPSFSACLPLFAVIFKLLLLISCPLHGPRPLTYRCSPTCSRLLAG